jgi:hypothetical protein
VRRQAAPGELSDSRSSWATRIRTPGHGLERPRRGGRILQIKTVGRYPAVGIEKNWTQKMVHEEPGADRQQAGAIIARIRFEPGISLVDGRTAEDVKEELIRQLNDPESVLRQGKYGSRIKSLQTVHANTSAAGMYPPPPRPVVSAHRRCELRMGIVDLCSTGGRSGEPVGMAQRRPTSAMDHSLASSGSCTGTDAHTPDIGQGKEAGVRAMRTRARVWHLPRGLCSATPASWACSSAV